MLSKYELLHLFPVPPAMSANLRKALYPSGAKDDPRDADLLVDLLLQHRDKLRRLSPDSEATRRIQNLVEERRHLVEEKTAQSNRLTNHLKIYFPQILEWFDRLDTERCAPFWSSGRRWRNCKKFRQHDCGRSSASSAVTIPNWWSAASSESGRRCRRFGIER
jgi:hypothetical protein